MRTNIVVIGIVMLLGVQAGAQQLDVLGTWRGTSTCVDKEHYPACGDETVVYEVRAKGTVRDTVTIRADKIVNDAREFMGENDFGRQADGSWATDIRTRIHAVWSIHVTGDHMTGAMVEEPVHRKIRDIKLDRARGS